MKPTMRLIHCAVLALLAHASTSFVSPNPMRAATPVTDNTPPTTPVAGAFLLQGTYFDVNWFASSDNVGVEGYVVSTTVVGEAGPYRIDSVTNPTHYYPIREDLADYVITIVAYDAARNVSAPLTYTMSIGDITPPSDLLNLEATTSGLDISLTWDASTDNVGIDHYLVGAYEVVPGVPDPICLDAFPVTTTSATYTAPREATTTVVGVIPVDAANNVGVAQWVVFNVPDLPPPTTPANFRATDTSPDRIELTWDAAQDNIGVADYLLVRSGPSDTATYAGLTAAVADLSPSTTYTFQLFARDTTGNLSAAAQLRASTTATSSAADVGAFAKTFRAYPNPVRRDARLSLLGIPAEATLNVIDSDGRVHRLADHTGDGLSEVLDTPGLYVVEAVTPVGDTQRTVIVVY